MTPCQLFCSLPRLSSTVVQAVRRASYDVTPSPSEQQDVRGCRSVSESGDGQVDVYRALHVRINTLIDVMTSGVQDFL